VRKIIVFSGLDCSGKSTQIDFLDRKFAKNNQRSFVFWSRGGYTSGYQKLKIKATFVLKAKVVMRTLKG